MGSYYKYITAFDTTAQYNTFKQSDKYIEPNLSYIVFADTVKYNPSGVISSVSISNTSIQIPYLGSYKLFAVPTPNHAGKNGIIWLSNNDDIATVDQGGVVTGIKAGEAVITAKTIYGGFTKHCKVSVQKITPTVTAPTAKSGLVYTGSAQELINAGSTSYGTMKYSLDNSTWSTSVPSGTNAGTYTVYYKVEGDSNINDVAAQSVSCSIGKADQSAPTATGASVDYGNTATATASGGGGQGSLEWSNGNTRTEVGSHTTSARWSGNSNYNASPYSNSVTLTVNDPYVGHAYVDLGLPSGTKWATMNIGASSETDYGNYYQYGKGADQYAATSGQSDYSGTENPLDSSVDTAVQVWGGQWHMPTQAQLNELTANTTYTWETNFNGSGINGCKFTATNGNYVFLSAAGYYFKSDYKGGVGVYGGYWSSSSSSGSSAYCLGFNSSDKSVNGITRNCGYPVRPVVG